MFIGNMEAKLKIKHYCNTPGAEIQRDIDRMENWGWFWIFVILSSPIWGLIGLIVLLDLISK